MAEVMVVESNMGRIPRYKHKREAKSKGQKETEGLDKLEGQLSGHK